MAYTQHELGRRFRYGDTKGSATNVAIQENDDATVLVGYGWAIYAKREKDTGKITYYEGWYGYSKTTSCQITRMELPYMADEVSDESPEIKAGVA